MQDEDWKPTPGKTTFVINQIPYEVPDENKSIFLEIARRNGYKVTNLNREYDKQQAAYKQYKQKLIDSTIQAAEMAMSDHPDKRWVKQQIEKMKRDYQHFSEEDLLDMYELYKEDIARPTAGQIRAQEWTGGIARETQQSGAKKLLVRMEENLRIPFEQAALFPLQVEGILQQFIGRSNPWYVKFAQDFLNERARLLTNDRKDEESVASGDSTLVLDQ